MDSHDIDKFTDMRLIMKYQGTQAVSLFSKKLNFSFQAALHFGDTSLELSYFAPERLVENREISILLAQTNARKQGDLYFVSNEINQPMLFESLQTILQGAKSGILDNVYLENGYFFFSMRFNSAEMAKFSAAILDLTKRFESVGVEYLGPNPGLGHILGESASRTGLTNVKWEYDMPESSFNSTPISALGKEWVADVRYMTKNDVVPQLFRTRDKIENPKKHGFNVVSEKDHLYEMTLSNRGSIIREYHLRSYERKIVRFTRHLHYVDEKLIVETAIPTVQTKDLLQAISLTEESFPNFNIKLLRVNDI
jgi:hypothetical protein